MRRTVIVGAVTGGAALAVRALAPRLHARLLATCEGMFEQMPDTFPPKRMMRGIEEIRANTARTVELLEAREPYAGQQAGAPGQQEGGRGARNGRRERGRMLMRRGW